MFGKKAPKGGPRSSFTPRPRREIQIEDPDGNVLRFAADGKEGQSFGEWLDMHGTRWIKSPAGSWTRVDPG